MDETFWCAWCQTRHPNSTLEPKLRLKKRGHRYCAHGYARNHERVAAKLKKPRRYKRDYAPLIKYIEEKTND